MKTKEHFIHQLNNKKLNFFKQTGVASIEYALIAALIAVAILGTLQITGSANGGLWGVWTSRFITAVNDAIGR